MEYAQIFVDNVFRLHDLPKVIISDQDPRFTGKFWRAMFDLLGTDLRFSTVFHPQTNGQFERMIQTLENFLRPYVERHPQTWSQYLALAEFAANNAINVATGYSPFYLNSGATTPLYHQFSCMAGVFRAKSKLCKQWLTG